MGMYDDYEPEHDVPCPNCGREVITWQGKDGACAGLTFKQGEALPERDHDGDPVEGLEDGFTIYSDCRPFGCGKWIEATGVMMDGRWSGLTNVRAT